MSGEFVIYCTSCDARLEVYAFPNCSKCGETIMLCDDCAHKHKCETKNKKARR